MSSPPRPESATTSTSWLDVAAERIQGKTEHYVIQGDDGFKRPFIGEHHLYPIWEGLFDYHSSRLPDIIIESKDFILNIGPFQQRCLLFASILISIGWQDWHTFRQIFFDEQTGQIKRADADLPLKVVDFIDPPSLRDTFLERQYRFLPPYIRRGQIRVTSAHALPFTEEVLLSDPEQSNPASRVTRVRVASGYCPGLSAADDHHHEPLFLARKRCAPTEHETMQKLRRQLASHNRIVESFCTVEIGQDFSILLPFADGGDLHHRLWHADSGEGERDAFWNPAAERTTHPRSIERLTAEMLTEMRNLVSAVKFLHSQEFGGKESFYHMDLKPNNVLVYFGKYSNDPVGRWKVADFGLSVFHQLPSMKSGASQTNVKRHKGAFQPPEVDADWSHEQGRPQGVNQKGDIWSLGGILCTILAYVLGGSQSVKGLNHARLYISVGDGNDFFYWIDPETRKPQLKKGIVSWLETVADEPGADVWICGMLHLVNWCLQVQAKDRPLAGELYDRLKDVVTEVTAKSSGTERSPWLEEAFANRGRFTPRGKAREGQSTSPRRNEGVNIVNVISQGSSSTPTTENQEPRSVDITSSSVTSAAQDKEIEPGSASTILRLGRKDTCKVRLCPSTTDIAVLKSRGAEISRLCADASERTEKVEQLKQANTEEYGDAILRQPYCILITAARSQAEFITYGDSEGQWFENLGAIFNGYPFSTFEIALSGLGQVALLHTYTEIGVYDNTEIKPVTYSVLSQYPKERFGSVHFNIAGDLLLACGGKRFFLWERKSPTWNDCAHEKPRTGDIPWSRTKLLKAVPMRHHRGFVVYDDQELFAVFLMGDQLSITPAIPCPEILSAIIPPDDDYLFYVRRVKTTVKQGRFKLARPKWTFHIFQRSISSGSIDSSEKSIQQFDNLECDEKADAQLSIRQTEASEELVIVTSKGQVQSLGLNKAAVRRNSRRTQSLSAMSGVLRPG
ncbi:hypothetical protein H2200_001250 [Cladophialophora chaetospira]|uniref:Protein kinase domain-containing protein n=1 Tax=Cladophialophora chaetospira TaxID=386627 RepID=A0AA39CNW2_9EURO|nr:hypothetical protein H2200_001250 [Cladophialophora chaetospira]